MFSRGTFFENCKAVPIMSYASAGTDRSSEVIDTKGFGRVVILVHLHGIAAGAVSNLFVQTSDVASNETTLTSGADLAGSSQTLLDTDDNNLKYIEFKPTKRYAIVTMNKDGTNAQAESMIAILFQAKTRPITAALGTSTIGEGTGTVLGENLGEAIQGTQ